MKGFQLQLALLIVVAIIAVVAFATTVTVVLIQPPEPKSVIAPIARAIEIVVAAEQAGTTLNLIDREGLAIVDKMPTGERAPWPTNYLVAQLINSGVVLEGVFERSSPPGQQAVIRLSAGRWLVMDVPDMPQTENAIAVILAWASMIILGAISIALMSVRRITAPVMQIENAIASVGKEGILPFVEPSGSASEKETAIMLNKLGDRLKTAVASRMRLVAAAGHDLRTPLTRMLLRVEFLPEEERAAWRNDLEELGQIADSAIRLVREEAGDDEARTLVDLGQIVAELANELRELNLPMAIQYSGTFGVRTSRMAVKRALRNLMTNAASHGKGGMVRLSFEGSGVKVTIEDSGPGIPTHLLHQAFEPFFRVDAARHKPLPGAGLGLAIAKEIIERFGGTITLSNREPRGLKQEIWLPAASKLEQSTANTSELAMVHAAKAAAYQNSPV